MKLLRLLLGVVCGVAATGPMSMIMVWLHRRLPAAEQYPLPPREITSEAVEQIAGPTDIDPATRSMLTWLAHFGYGGTVGALYATAERQIPGGVATRGIVFGVLVWAVSYLGLLPGLHLLKPATDHPFRRNALMIVAHLVWGTSLALLYKVLVSDLARGNAAFHASPRAFRDTRTSKAQG